MKSIIVFMGLLATGASVPCTPGQNSTEICSLPRSLGFGRESWARFYFNDATGYCEKFRYRGSGGNLNNFVTYKGCSLTCFDRANCLSPKKEVKHGISFPIPFLKDNYYYNTERKRCSRVSLLLGPANKYKFNSKSDCETSCQYPEICSLPRETGTCQRTRNMWFYNSTSQMCEQFIYSGCGGNENRFRDENTCAGHCMKPVVL